MAKKYGVKTLSEALYSLDVYAFELNVSKNDALKKGEDADSYFSDLRFCYNLKYLAIQKMIKEKHVIFQKMEVVNSVNGFYYLFSVYRNKLGMPFRHPTEMLDLYAVTFSYDIFYPQYFKDTNMLEPFYSLRKTSKILLNYINRSADAVRYMKIDIFNSKNTKKQKEEDSE